MLFLYYYDVLGSLGLQVDAPVPRPWPNATSSG
jgi:hypothetical protein